MTLPQLIAAQDKALKELITKAGTVSHLSRMLGVSLSTAQGWVYRGRISKEGAKLVESHTLLGKSFKIVTLRPELDK